MRFLIIFVFSSIISSSNGFSVIDYGAVGDGKTDDSEAFGKAWKDTCESEDNSPTLEIPEGKTFLLGLLNFEGPCKASNVHISLSGNIISPEMSNWNGDKSKWIEFSHIEGLTIDGEGNIDGKGDTWWECGCDRPHALKFDGCNDLSLSGITVTNGPKIHISITNSKGVTINNIHVTAPEDSPNTDGIDISKSTNVQIQDSFIGTGDDCIAIKGGSSFVNITSVNCGPGHGISIGSLGENGENSEVEEIYVKNCTLTSTTNGIRIKTWQDGSGYARKVTFTKITLEKVKNPIVIDQYYCPHQKCDNQESDIKISDITYNGVYGSSIEAIAVTLNCSASVPCDNIQMNDINIECVDPGTKTTSICSNAHGTAKSTNPNVPCLEN